jgi:murein DD-endopeptidase MepM/ murein hydrolase activator NlpD
MACTGMVGRRVDRHTEPVATVIPTALSAEIDAGPAVVEAEKTPTSKPLKNPKLHDPMPGGWLGGWAGDTGVDIAGDHLPVYALAAGTLDYAEWGHTRWTRKPDTAFSIRLALDEPIPWGDGRKITHVYYTHLSKVENEQKEGARPRIHVEAGARIGVSGIGNGTPHLHLGLLLDNQVEQDDWTYILREHEVRKALGDYPNGFLLRGKP